MRTASPRVIAFGADASPDFGMRPLKPFGCMRRCGLAVTRQVWRVMERVVPPRRVIWALVATRSATISSPMADYSIASPWRNGSRFRPVFLCLG